MRQEHKDEAVVLVRRMAEQQTIPGSGVSLPLMRQLWELVDDIARTLPTPAEAA